MVLSCFESHFVTLACQELSPYVVEASLQLRDLPASSSQELQANQRHAAAQLI